MHPDCPIVLNFDVLEKRWTVRIIRNLHRHPSQFNELKHALRGITQGVLSSRLRELEKRGLVNRHILRKRPLSSRYSLTPVARGMFRCWKNA
ncbi:helix-turn-helix transcriptional regulator [Candidatus Micrarchaeota archaeon]|nr:helix-turn-helix transcriptional regulator [Candidatus Micrarchaeota archaeon]